MCLIEVGWSIVECFVWATKNSIAIIRWAIFSNRFERLGPGVGDAKLKSARVATVNLNLQTVVVGVPGVRNQLNVLIALERTQEIVSQRAQLGWSIHSYSRKWVPVFGMQIDELRTIGNPINVALLAEMPALRTHVTDFNDRLETEFLLNSKGVIVDGRRVKIGINRFQRCGPGKSCADKIGNLVDIAKIY